MQAGSALLGGHADPPSRAPPQPARDRAGGRGRRRERGRERAAPLPVRPHQRIWSVPARFGEKGVRFGGKQSLLSVEIEYFRGGIVGSWRKKRGFVNLLVVRVYVVLSGGCVGRRESDFGGCKRVREMGVGGVRWGSGEGGGSAESVFWKCAQGCRGAGSVFWEWGEERAEYAEYAEYAECAECAGCAGCAECAGCAGCA
eukprot:3025359-Rhodomonas_salina.1